MATCPEILASSARLAAPPRLSRSQHLETFGSTATDQFDPPPSNVDLSAEFDGRDDAFHRCVDRLADFERLFGRPVDLVTPGAIENECFLIPINHSRALVHAA